MAFHKVAYNSQRNNYNFAGKFSAWTQCFSTCAYMLLSYWAPKKFPADSDILLASYVDDVEATVGKPGIGEEIWRKFQWAIGINGKTSYYFEVHKAALQLYLNKAGVSGKAFARYGASWTEYESALKAGPVIIGTSTMGKLPNGHMILALGDDRFNDPFGDAKNNYRDPNGANVIYPKDWFKQYAEKGGGGPNKLNILWFQETT